MKRIVLTLTILCFTLSAFNQQESSVEKNEEAIKKLQFLEESIDTVKIPGDTTRIKIGRKEVSIFDSGDETEIRVRPLEQSQVSPEVKTRMSRVRKFRGHWSGFEMGLNNFLDADFSTSHGVDYMELRASKSLNVNLNFLQYNLRLANDRIGLVTGMGLEFNDYKFINDFTIERNGGIIEALDLSAFDLEKTKLSTTYLTVPLLLEFQTSQIKRSHRLYLSGGVIGGVKLGSHTKFVHFESGKKRKEKLRDDFYINPFRYGVTVRAGYRQLNLFANYYFTPLFQNNKGPELYPFTIGLSLFGF